VTKVGCILVSCRAAEDWVVCEEGTGREFGHYATQAEAESVGVKLARKRKIELVVQNEAGKRTRRTTSRSWFGRLFGR
jgi:hypothetical protein